MVSHIIYSPRPTAFSNIYNDLNNVVEFSDTHYFADDTNVLYSTKSLKDINKKINSDLKNIVM